MAELLFSRKNRSGLYGMYQSGNQLVLGNPSDEFPVGLVAPQSEPISGMRNVQEVVWKPHFYSEE